MSKHDLLDANFFVYELTGQFLLPVSQLLKFKRQETISKYFYLEEKKARIKTMY